MNFDTIDNSCELLREKEVLNNGNVYNHNFSVKYCYCDSAERDEMIQCLICEDWYHFDCLNTDVFNLSNKIILNIVKTHE